MAGKRQGKERRQRARVASVMASRESLPYIRNGLARNYLDIAGVILIALDRKGRVTMINKRGCELLGYPERDIVGRNWFTSFIPSPQRKAVFSVFKAIMAGRMEMAERFENPVLTKKGDQRLISWRNSVILGPDGKVQSTLSSGEDITELRRTEESLRKSEQRLRTVFQKSPVGILLAAPDYRFMSANPAACRIFGYREDEMRKMTFKDLTHPSHKTRDIGQMDLLKRGGIKMYRTEKRYIRKDGRVIWGLITVTAVRDERGEVQYFLAIVNEITHSKETEEKLLRQNEELEEMSHMRERFMADIAHELKTPLSVIMLNLEMMKGMQNKPLCDIAPIRGLLWRNALRISNSLDQVLQLTSIGSIRVKCRTFDLSEMMEEVKRDYSPLALSKGIALRFEGPRLKMRSDRRLLSSAVSNLVSNAIKFTSDGSVEVAWKAGASLVKIDVSDTGIGIRRESRGRVFELFFKENHDAPGSGVGLSLSSEFIKKLGGRLTFISKIGKGTTFTITIPKR